MTMRFPLPRRPLWAPLLLTLLVSACGGGGGGGDSKGDNTNPSAGSDLLGFTIGNTKAAAILSLVSVDSTTSMLRDARSSADAIDEQLSQPAQGGAQLGILAREALAHAQALSSAAADQPAGSYRGKISCAVSGSIDIIATVAKPGTYTAGDRLDLGYTNCVGRNDPLNGVISLDVGEITGDPATNGTLSATLRYVDLRSGLPDNLVSTQGEARFFQSRSPGQPETGWLRTNSLTHSFNVSGKRASLTTLDLDLGYSTRSDGFAYTISQNMTLDFPAAQGKVALSTTQTLLADTSGRIFGGKLLINGRNSTQYVSYLGPGMVRLETDTNNDGKMDVDSISNFSDLYYMVWLQ